MALAAERERSFVIATYIEELRDVIRRLHGAKATPVESVPVKKPASDGSCFSSPHAFSAAPPSYCRAAGPPLPIDMQPDLAEFFKHILLPITS
jgi:hypothetical protein